MQSTYHRAIGRLLALAIAAAPLAFTAAARASELVISGAGWGHGVGMSQEGALGYAERGFSYRAILSHYFSGTSLGQAPPGAVVRVLVGRRVRRVPLETYVRGVVGAEMPASWPLAALEAQAVASRTYALTSHAGGSRFDVYADTRSQMYKGVAAQTPQTDAAVAATAGQVITYAGQPVISYFFASSGGRTEDVQNAFPGSLPAPWLRGVADPYDRGPLHSWSLTLSFASASARLGRLVRGSFLGIEVTRRGFSPRILSAYVLGSGGRTLVTGAQLAARLGLYDTWAYFSVRDGAALTPELDRSGPANANASPPEPAAPESGPAGGAQAGSSPTGAGANGAGSGSAGTGSAVSGPGAPASGAGGGTPAPA